MNKEIFIFRHGETDLNRKRIVQGSGVDASINDLGRRQAEAFFRHYQDEAFEVVLTSALRRTHETVAPFLTTGIRWEQHADINEIGWGRQEGKESQPWMIKLYQETISQWQSGNFDARLDDGESAAEMRLRLSRFVEQLKRRTEKKILVCSHGRAMRALMCLLAGQPLTEMEGYRHANTGLYKVAYQDGRFSFLLENDTRHLQSLESETA